MKIRLLAVLSVLCFSCCKIKKAPLKEKNFASTEYNVLSEQLLEHIKNEMPTTEITDKLAAASFDDLQKSLVTDAQKYAFWVNIYNAYIQLILKEHPEYYEDRGTFFSKEQITIAGHTVAFETIEHGILRKSQWGIGLGYVRKWFPGKFERKLRVNKRDYRIHFALNCGAKDCPPVAIYTPLKVDEQFKKGTARFLQKTTTYTEDTAKVTALFSWFRGDFGGKSGTKTILEQHQLIPADTDIDLEYTNYDWTLDLDNFISL